MIKLKEGRKVIEEQGREWITEGTEKLLEGKESDKIIHNWNLIKESFTKFFLTDDTVLYHYPDSVVSDSSDFYLDRKGVYYRTDSEDYDIIVSTFYSKGGPKTFNLILDSILKEYIKYYAPKGL